VTDGAVRRTRTRRQVLTVVGLGVVVAAFLALFAQRHGFFDLKVYYGAVNYWVHDRGMLYDYLKPNSKYGFTYPTFAALTMLPMAVVPWAAAITISLLLSFAATGWLMWRLVDPISRREGWTRWYAYTVALLLLAAFEPFRETVGFGQVNMILLGIVAADLLIPVARGRWWGGFGIGLATAIKLTPGIFIVYLLITRRFRAAAVAATTAAAATLLAGALAPAASREFWTNALWDTSRVGALGFISNQSLQGLVARLDPLSPSRALWIVLVLAALGVWGWRVRTATLVDGLALTGIVACLISPVTWVHHLVWLIPALILLVDRALTAGPRRRLLLGFAIVAYAILCSRLVWVWEHGSKGVVGFLGSNAYVYVSIALLCFVPVRSAVEAGDVPDLVEADPVSVRG
jgi:alpha-1,2-mannosyltransferase